MNVSLPSQPKHSPPTVDEIRSEFIDQIEQSGKRSIHETSSSSLDKPVATKVAGGIVDVPNLLKLDGPEFVIALYDQVLGRTPDEAGLRHHLGLLANGADKSDLVRSLRGTSEGEQFGSMMIGLWPRNRLARLYALPFIGRPARIMVSLLGVSRLKSDVQMLHDFIVVLQRQSQELRQDLEGLRRGYDNQLGEIQDRLRSVQKRVTDSVSRGQLVVLTRRVEAFERAQTEQIEALRSELAAEAWADPLLLLADRQDEADRRLGTLGVAFDEARMLRDAITTIAQAFSTVAEHEGWSETGAALVARAAQALQLQDDRIRIAERLAAEAHDDMRDQSRRLSLLLETVRRRAEPFDAGQHAIVEDEQDHLLDSLYVEFEARFRGSRDLIKQRQRVHLDVMVTAGAGAEGRPIIDVGAGRGEWLELLRDEGLQASGIDLNRTMVASCKALGLDCIMGDAVAELALLEAGSIGAVTGFHLIEHLPFRTMVSLLDEAHRVLAPGGVILFETPNPANLQVGSRFFYLDPTHRNPLPGEMVAMIAEARGFDRVRIVPLHPMSQTFSSMDKQLGRQLDALLHGPQDYALIAYKA